MCVHLTTIALYSLVYKSIQERSTMIAKSGAGVGVNLEFVRRFGVLSPGNCLRSRAGEWHIFMAAFVDDERANLALISLRSHETPNKIFAMAAESWLSQEASNKLMVLNCHYIFLLKSTASVYSTSYSSAASIAHCIRHIFVSDHLHCFSYSATWVTSRPHRLIRPMFQ